MILCIECRREFVALEPAIKHIEPIQAVTYNDAAPGRPKKIKTVEVAIPTRKHQIFEVDV